MPAGKKLSRSLRSLGLASLQRLYFEITTYLEPFRDIVRYRSRRKHKEPPGIYMKTTDMVLICPSADGQKLSFSSHTCTYQLHVVCQLTPTLPLQQQRTLRLHTGRVGVSTRPDPERSGAVEIRDSHFIGH